MAVNWGLEIKELRETAGLTQAELAVRSGLTRAHISRIEIGYIQDPKEDVLQKLAAALDLTLADLRRKLYGLDLPETNRLPQPTRHPIYKDFPFHAGSPVRPVDYFYRNRPDKAPKNVEGYIVHGNSQEPTNQEGDVIIVDREGAIDNGDIVACLVDEDLLIGRLRKIADELWLENNLGRRKFQECLLVAPVIEINRRIK
jgi:repressor LexA